MTFNAQPDRFPCLPPRPQPFHVTEPALQNGIWSFWLTADEPVIHFVSQLNCVLSFSNSPFLRRPNGRVMININPRYDPQEAWHWIQQLIEDETQIVDLGEPWESAIDVACQSEDEV